MNVATRSKLFNIVLIFDIILEFGICYLSKHITQTIRPEVNVDYKFFIAYILITIFFFYEYDLYDAKENRRQDTIISVLLTSIITNFIVFLLNFIFSWKCDEIIMYSLMLVLMCFCLTTERVIAAALNVKISGSQKLLIIESVNVTSRLARKLKYSCTNLNKAWYMLIDDTNHDEVSDVINSHMPNYDCVFISSSLKESVRDEIFRNAILTGKYIEIIPTIDRVSAMSATIIQFADTPLIQVNTLGLTKLQKLIKRAFDFCVSLIGIIVLSPLLLFCAIAIKLDSPGPVIYKQERLTIHKKKFFVYKFRTMRQDAEKFGAMLATQNDPRITKIGKVLRATRLDELPQMFNILFGTMSIVGPRPERPVFAEDFIKNVKYYEMRYFVKAGLTGYAQIYGKYNTRASDKILMDLIYITRYSFWLDIKLILLSVKIMFIKESTEGVDDKKDILLNTVEKEKERRNANYYNELASR